MKLRMLLGERPKGLRLWVIVFIGCLGFTGSENKKGSSNIVAQPLNEFVFRAWFVSSSV